MYHFNLPKEHVKYENRKGSEKKPQFLEFGNLSLRGRNKVKISRVGVFVHTYDGSYAPGTYTVGTYMKNLREWIEGCHINSSRNLSLILTACFRDVIGIQC